MRKEGVPTQAVARRFRLSRSRIQQIELRAADDVALANRRATLLAQMQAADDLERLWPVGDLADACIGSRTTKIRLLTHFSRTGKAQISLRELMEMCQKPPRILDALGRPPLLRIPSIGKKCFWCVADGLTSADLGSRCNEEWRSRLAEVKQHWGMPA